MIDLETFNVCCTVNGMPAIDSEQWALLCSTRQGQTILTQSTLEPGEMGHWIEWMVRSVSPMARTSLDALGYRYDVQEVLDVAVKEKRKLFAAMYKSHLDPAARQYLANLGFEKVRKPAAPAPYYSFHVYGNKGALCFSEAQTRANNRATINVEGAVALLGSTKQYDWRSKTIVQLTPEEMFMVLALLNGKLPQVQFAGHGPQHDKMIEFHQQQTSFYVRLVQRGRPPISVPMLIQDSLNLTSLLYKQLKLNHPHLGQNEIDVMQDQIVRMRPGSTQSVLSQ